jgi:hypothetical protein
MLCDYQNLNASLSEDLLEEAKAVFQGHLTDSKTRTLDVALPSQRNCRRCCMR